MAVPAVIDFRFLDEGLGGPLNRRKPSQKRKRCEDEDGSGNGNGNGDGAGEEPVATAMEEDSQVQPNKRVAITGEDGRPQALGKATYDGVNAGKMSGRKWKQAKTSRAAAVKQVGRKATLEERNRTRSLKKAYKERLGELKEQIRLNKRAKREQIESRKKIKKENELKSQSVQRITNPKTLKKMSKKQRKNLRIIPD